MVQPPNGAGSLRHSDSIRNSSNTGPESRNMVAQKSELRPQIRSGPCGQGRQPGTEFLDAETGRQKPQPKCANAPRDQNPGIDWPEMPAETPYLTSYRKRAVCGDWMVAVAVERNWSRGAKFPDIWEFTGKISGSWPTKWDHTSKFPM